jgi:addiction module RelB/DinJ family antitoxin
MATASITVRTDEEIKRKAVQIFSELGMDMSTGVNVLLHALVRENGFPFPVTLSPDAEYRTWMKQELQKSWERQSDPEAKWYSTEEIRTKFGV